MELLRALEGRKDPAWVHLDGFFEYTGTLSQRTIRLIKLLTGERDDQLHCKLLETSLDVNPSYTALSYVWGYPSDTRPIYCGHKIVEVTKNLFNALWQLRETAMVAQSGPMLSA